MPHGTGPVDVLLAGSLVDVTDRQLAPGFRSATGFTLVPFFGGSQALASEIKGRVEPADVFVSAAPSVNSSLEGRANGDLASWYVTFATSPLVLGYSPSSRFARELRAQPWYQVVTRPGFRLGRTNPTTDPKGKLAVQALDAAGSAHHQPALARLAQTGDNVFPEAGLVGRLQSGQLDAGFFYQSEAKAAGLSTAPLTGTALGATFTVTILNDAPHRTAALAFVMYLFSPPARKALIADGFRMASPPTASGSGVPAPVAASIR